MIWPLLTLPCIVCIVFPAIAGKTQKDKLFYISFLNKNWRQNRAIFFLMIGIFREFSNTYCVTHTLDFNLFPLKFGCLRCLISIMIFFWMPWSIRHQKNSAFDFNALKRHKSVEIEIFKLNFWISVKMLNEFLMRHTFGSR